MDYLFAVGNLLLDLKAETLIGGILAALVVALATAALYRAVRRRCSEENPTVMASVILVGNVLSMIVAAGYVSHRQALEMPRMHSRPGPAVPFQSLSHHRHEKDWSRFSQGGRWSREYQKTSRPPDSWTEQRRARESSPGEETRVPNRHASDQRGDGPSGRAPAIPDIVNHS